MIDSADALAAVQALNPGKTTFERVAVPVHARSQNPVCLPYPQGDPLEGLTEEDAANYVHVEQECVDVARVLSTTVMPGQQVLLFHGVKSDDVVLWDFAYVAPVA